MKAYLIASNGMPVMCCTSEDEADLQVKNLSNNVGACKIPVDLEIDRHIIEELAISIMDNINKILKKNNMRISDNNKEDTSFYGIQYFDLTNNITDTIINMLE